MRTILVILDGAADLPSHELNDETPYEAALKPNLDFFANEGKTGLIYTVNKDVAPESDVAVTALLGYDPYKYFTGRGPLEAYGSGIPLGKNFLALRTNFATLSHGIITDRRVGRSLTTNEAHILADAINKNVKLKCKFTFKSTTEHRGVLVLYGKFSDNISNVDPAYEKSGTFGIAKSIATAEILECKGLDKKAEETAEIINDFVRQAGHVLENQRVNKSRARKGLPIANAILPRDAGNRLPSFPKKRNWAAVVGMPLEIGLAQLAGMKILKVKYPPITSREVYKHLYKCLNAEIETALRYIKRTKNNLYIHIKETDIPGHDGKPEEKKKMIELLDKKFFSKLRKIKNIRLAVTSDHSTPCMLKSHSAGPVPLLIYDGKGGDNLKSFSESSCRNGSLGIILGKDLMKKL